PVVRNFWEVEFATWNDKFASEAVAPVLNKVGAFTANPLVRNIIGQPRNSFNIRQIMDDRKILIVNLSRGLVGEDNAALLGALLVTKIQLASMSRADIPAGERVPFYLYVDEFQNFATDSFATILSEARKYALNLTVANQYIAQMSQDVKDAVFGNVGSMVAFRMGADDARSMQRYFEPKFEEYDLVHMNNRNFVINMTIDGEKAQAFSATTLDLPDQEFDQTAAIVEHSRGQFAVSRSEAEEYIHRRYEIEAKSRPAAKSAMSKPKVAPKPERAPTPKPEEKPAKKKPDNAANGMGHAAVGSVVERVKLKRHRKRRSRKKSTDSLANTSDTSERTIFER
ncbi:MAG TPA: type IV secretory system conjugative DNA transfer family protein, partial [Verrucomicrobiae bacterium]|nr:type IV secretory system conjugative DNA transfer family protein [Verrucomicrobiae bacterium]